MIGAPDTSAPSTLGDLLRSAAEAAPDRPALIFIDEAGVTRRTLSYRDLFDAAERGARRLLRDLRPGERVAVWSGNRAEWVIAEFAAALAGLVMVAVNPGYSESEARYVFADSAADAVFVDSSWNSGARHAMIARLQPELPALRHVYDIAELDQESSDPGSDSDISLPTVHADDPAQLLYTSGTTGPPKGALLHHRGLTLTPPTAARLFDLGEAPRWLNAMPMFHVGGCGLPTIGSVALLGTQVMLERYRSPVLLDVMGRERITFFGGVPAMIYDLLNGYDPAVHDWSELRQLLSGAAAVSPTMVREVEARLGVKFVLAYGQTEAHGHISQTLPSDSPEDKAMTIGQPLPHVEVRLVDPDTGALAGPGEQGELWCRSRAVLIEYVNRPDSTQSTVTSDGWLRTGDVCRQDERGYLTFVGRRGEIINRGGEKFAPRDVEEALTAHPAVVAAAVFGIPDNRLGQRVAALIQPATQEVDLDELHEYVGDKVAGFKVPEEWRLVSELPVTPSGKIARGALLEVWRRADGSGSTNRVLVTRSRSRVPSAEQR